MWWWIHENKVWKIINDILKKEHETFELEIFKTELESKLTINQNIQNKQKLVCSDLYDLMQMFGLNFSSLGEIIKFKRTFLHLM